MADDDLTNRLRDAAYTAVGLGVLGVQRLQVRRRELSRQLQPQMKEAAARLQRLAAAADERVNPVLERLEQDLPEATRDMVRTARSAAAGARDAVFHRATGGG